MKIAVIGSGMVGRALAGRTAQLGHEVVVGTRDPQATLARSDGDSMGTPPFSVWSAEHPEVALRTFADAASDAELVINATSGVGALEALRLAGAEALAGKVLVDVSNPLDFSAGFPPTLFVKDTDSLGEQIQRAFPEAKVVKTLNTLGAELMVDPASLAGGDHSIFMSGDDAGAKATVTDLLQSFGWHDIIDLGELSAARGTEMLLPIWLRLMGALGTRNFNIKIVR
ncbi:MAG: NADPH-dependent F420 reductase [Solirubrobacteraceae bacterium]